MSGHLDKYSRNNLPGEIVKHRYTIEQARILLDILKYHNASTMLPSFHQVKQEALDEALDKLRLELSEFIATDDGLGFIVPVRDEKGLI
ncbi:MAG: hypothetical protein ACXWFI_05675 [Methylobacter sp.]